MSVFVFFQVAWGYSGAGILNSGVLPVIQLFNTHLFTVLVLINPCLFFLFAFKSIQIFWLDADMGLKMCYLSLVNREEIWAWNSHVSANHKVNMSIIHCSYDLIYQDFNYSFSWFLSLSLPDDLHLTLPVLSYSFQSDCRWMIYGWLTWPCTTCKRPSMLMEKTNMDTVRSIWAALTGGPWRGAREPMNTLDAQEDIKKHTRESKFHTRLNRVKSETNMQRLWIACLHVQIKRGLAHNIVLNHLWETKPMEGDPKWTDQRGGPASPMLGIAMTWTHMVIRERLRPCPFETGLKENVK